jgi:hypothetical protein
MALKVTTPEDLDYADRLVASAAWAGSSASAPTIS